MKNIQSGIGATIPTPEEVFNKALNNQSFDIKVAMPGIIQSWDSAKQTATIKLALREKINIDGNPTWTEIPLLVDVPLVTIKGGGHLICTAINAGDECWVWFSDACIDASWQSGGVQNQADLRRHDLSDGFFMPSLFSQPKKISNYPSEGIEIRDESGDTSVKVVSGTVTVKGSTVNVQSTTATIQSTSATITGSNVTIGNSTTIDGKNFLDHQHKNVTTGSGTTGGVV